MKFLTLSCIIILSTAANAADKCGSVDRIINAMRMMEVLYPEIKGEEFSLQFSGGNGGPLSGPTGAGSLLIAIDRPTWGTSQDAGRQNDKTPRSVAVQNAKVEPPVNMEFRFIDPNSIGKDPVCRPVSFMNDTTSQQMKEARDVINAHPEWTDRKELEAATEHGLRFGPDKKNAVLGQIPLKELTAFYGPLKIKRAEFDIHGNGDKCARCSFADLHWSIDAEEVGTGRTLQIAIEPFDGKIDGISEHRERK